MHIDSLIPMSFLYAMLHALSLCLRVTYFNIFLALFPVFLYTYYTKVCNNDICKHTLFFPS